MFKNCRATLRQQKMYQNVTSVVAYDLVPRSPHLFCDTRVNCSRSDLAYRLQCLAMPFNPP